MTRPIATACNGFTAARLGRPLPPVHDRWISPVQTRGRGICRQTHVRISDGEEMNKVFTRLFWLHICGTANTQVRGVIEGDSAALSTRCPRDGPQAGACRPPGDPSYPQPLW